MPRRRKRPVEGTREIHSTAEAKKQDAIDKKYEEAAKVEESLYKESETFRQLSYLCYDEQDDPERFKILLKKLYQEYDRKTVGMAIKNLPKPRR